MITHTARILVATLVALAYIASATQIQTSFLTDPVGPKTFPILVGVVAAIGLSFVIPYMPFLLEYAYVIPVLQFFTGNIGFHHIHHLDPRIPNYNLARAHREQPCNLGLAVEFIDA